MSVPSAFMQAERLRSRLKAILSGRQLADLSTFAVLQSPLAKHPEKTFVGRIAKGFDFLGYAFGLEGLRVSEPALARFHERCSRLQEQEPGRARLREYVRRWSGWVRGGLGEDAVRGLFGVGPGGLLSGRRFRLAVAFD